MTSNQRAPRVAVLLAAGRGTRLRPHTDSVPKPLLPVEGRPTIDFVLRSAINAGVDSVIFVTNYLEAQIKAYIGDGKAWGITPYFAHQAERLGTADALKCAVAPYPDLFAEPFILTATDYLLGPHYLTKLVETWQTSGADIGVALKEVPEEELAGRSSVRFKGRFEIEEIVEKPAPGKAPSRYSGSLTFIFPPQITRFVQKIDPSPRGEYELQTAINLMLQEGFTGKGALLPTPNEWQAPSE